MRKSLILLAVVWFLSAPALADPVTVQYNYSGEWVLVEGEDPLGLDGCSFSLSFQIPGDAVPDMSTFNVTTILRYSYSGILSISGTGTPELNADHAVNGYSNFFMISAPPKDWVKGFAFDLGGLIVALPGVGLSGGSLTPRDGTAPPQFPSSALIDSSPVFGGSMVGKFDLNCGIASGTAVPEASSLLLLSGGLGLVALLRKRLG